MSAFHRCVTLPHKTGLIVDGLASTKVGPGFSLQPVVAERAKAWLETGGGRFDRNVKPRGVPRAAHCCDICRRYPMNWNVQNKCIWQMHVYAVTFAEDDHWNGMHRTWQMICEKIFLLMQQERKYFTVDIQYWSTDIFGRSLIMYHNLCYIYCNSKSDFLFWYAARKKTFTEVVWFLF